MEVSKILIYCTKGGICLKDCKDYDYPRFQLDNEKKYCDKKKCEMAGVEILNGTVCFECDCKEAIKLMYWWYNIEKGDDGFYGDNKDGEMFCNRNWERLGLGKDDISTNDKLFEYGKGEDLYAYHFENVKPINPMPITQLYKDEACTIHLTRAPESYCFAYRRHDCTDEEARMINYYWDSDKWLDSEGHECFQDFYCWYYIEKVLVFSIRSHWLALEVNIDPKTGKPYKDLEVRKNRINNAGIEYK